MLIESHTPDAAVNIANLHVQLNPDHQLVVFACDGCGNPIGVLCATCREPLCAVQSPDCCG